MEEGGLWCSGPMVVPTVVPAGLPWQGHNHSCPQLCRAGRVVGEEVCSEGRVSWNSKASSCLILSPGQMYTLPLSFCSWGDDPSLRVYSQSRPFLVSKMS